MAINRISNPVAAATPPTATTGYTYQNNKLDAFTLNLTPPWPISGSNVVKGALFNIESVLYQADAATAITGTASNYVKITPAGATASAAFVADLTDVAWDDDYNAYLDASGNLYVFDETTAFFDKEIDEVKTFKADVIVGASLTTEALWHTFLSTYIPTSGDRIIPYIGIVYTTAGATIPCLYILNGTGITIYATGSTDYNFSSGDATDPGVRELRILGYNLYEA